MNQNPPQPQPPLQIQFFKENSNEEASTTSTSFFQSITEKTGSVFSYIKSKTPLGGTPSETTQASVPNLTQITEETFTQLQSKALSVVCKEIKKTQLNDCTIISVLQNPKVMDKGYFDNYISYEVRTDQFKWLVTRRYSDFIWLRSVLIAQFPGELVPQMPKKKMGPRRFEEDFVKKRMKFLQWFIDEINRNELFKSSETLVLFLSCPDRVLFDFNLKQLTPASLTVSSLSSMPSFTGTAKVIDFDVDNYIINNNYFMNINNYFKLQEETMGKLTKNLKEYYNSTANAMLSLKEVEDNLKTLSLINSNTGISLTIDNAYRQFRVFINSWKHLMITQTCLVKEKMQMFFKTVNNNSKSFIELTNKQEELKNDYLNKKTKLMLKKETQWKSTDINKWDMWHSDDVDKTKIYQDKGYAMQKMCHKETLELNDVSNLLGYFYSKTGGTFWELIHQFEKSFVLDMKEFSAAFEPTLAEAINVWSNFTTNIGFIETK